MQDFERGTVRAGNLTFTYLTEGDGALALCLHGFPGSPYSYRYLFPALAEAGFRAAAPFNRGFAPTERSLYFWYLQMQRMSEDVISAGNFAFIDRIWADWSPGYDASEDLLKVKECIRE